MLKKLFMALSLVAIVGCSPQKDKDGGTSAQNPAEKTAINKDPMVMTPLPPPPPLSIDTSFSTQEFCKKDGYEAKQCDQAYSVAYAMYNADAPKYATVQECRILFEECISKPADKLYRPIMAGFSVAGQEKGKFSNPSKDKPLYLLPLYKATDGKLVEIKPLNGGIFLLPVGQKMTEQMANQKPVAPPKTTSPKAVAPKSTAPKAASPKAAAPKAG